MLGPKNQRPEKAEKLTLGVCVVSLVCLILHSCVFYIQLLKFYFSPVNNSVITLRQYICVLLHLIY